MSQRERDRLVVVRQVAEGEIEEHEADGQMPKSRVSIEHRLDGTLRFRWEERYLLPAPLLARPTRAPSNRSS